MKTYCFSRSEELFRDEVLAESAKDALSTAINELGAEPGDRVYVGEREEPTDPEQWIDAEYVLEIIACRVYEEVGEASEGWPEAGQEAMDELTDRIRAIIRSWIARHGLKPTFYCVRHVQEFEVTAEMAGVE